MLRPLIALVGAGVLALITSCSSGKNCKCVDEVLAECNQQLRTAWEAFEAYAVQLKRVQRDVVGDDESFKVVTEHLHATGRARDAAIGGLGVDPSSTRLWDVAKKLEPIPEVPSEQLERGQRAAEAAYVACAAVKP